MKLSEQQVERLTLHNTFAIHQIAKWMGTRTDVPGDIRTRLASHIAAIEGVLVNTGHDWIQDEIQETEAALHT
ncbi:MAG: hypothetical protein JWO33_1430 [Caulobacteraceae bacterium]|nr:hypothetical protein [Caulobacteraceae bacterium]